MVSQADKNIEWSPLIPILVSSPEARSCVLAMGASSYEGPLRGRKFKCALPTSDMSNLRSVCRCIDRDNGERNPLLKAMTVLKEMLSNFVGDYGPIRPDQSLAIPKSVMLALESLATLRHSARIPDTCLVDTRT